VADFARLLERGVPLRRSQKQAKLRPSKKCPLCGRTRVYDPSVPRDTAPSCDSQALGTTLVAKTDERGQGVAGITQSETVTEDQQMNVRRERTHPRHKRSVVNKQQAVSSFGQNTETNTGGRQRRIENLRPPWPKGVSGNPGGRPKRQPVSEALARLADQLFPGDKRGRTYAEVAADRQFCLAASTKKGSTSAFSEIADRIEGKPRQSIDMTHRDDFLAGKTTEEKLFFAVHGYWPEESKDGEGKDIGHRDKKP
jgi:hypothetical protein